MPQAQEEAIKRSLREQHPDWSEERINKVTYGHLRNEEKRKKRRKQR